MSPETQQALDLIEPKMRERYEQKVLSGKEYTEAQIAKRLPDGKYLHIGLQRGWEDFIEYMAIGYDLFVSEFAV